MRKWALLAVVLVVAGLLVLCQKPAVAPSVPPSPLPPPPPAPVAVTPANPPASEDKSAGEPMVFSNDGTAGNILHAAEGVAGAGNARVSVNTHGGGRLICILTAGMQRNYSLDEGMEPEQFPFIQAQKFVPPDRHVLQTMSIYRSLAKKEMGFSAEQGDRIIVLLCPKEDWPSLDLRWPDVVIKAR